MTCKPKKAKVVKSEPLPLAGPAYWEQRTAICQSKECCQGDTCTITEEKHPGKSSIKNGVLRKDLACPRGHWLAIPSQCPRCQRKYGVAAAGVCVWCENEQKIEVANANLRRGSRSNLMLPRFARVPAIRIRPRSRKAATWCVAITSAPRKGCTLNRCLTSLESSGWGPVDVTVYAEPGTTPSDFGTRIDNPQRLGAWHNWLESCRRSVANDTDFVMTVQDDSLFHPDCRQLIESINWPGNAGFVSLYTPSHYSFDAARMTWKPLGIRPVYTRSLWGACALVWRSDVLAKVIAHPITAAWLGASPRTIASKKKHPEQIANVDTALGKILNAMSLAMYFTDPSPVTHIAAHSTLKHGGNRGKRNAIRPANLTLPLIPQVFGP